MKELKADDLNQVSGGMANPFVEGFCKDCDKNVLVNRRTSACYECGGKNTEVGKRPTVGK